MSERPKESESALESEIEKCKTSHRWFLSQTKNRMVMTTLWSVKPNLSVPEAKVVPKGEF